MSFPKAKRFQEPKDDTPGPGQYDVNMDYFNGYDLQHQFYRSERFPEHSSRSSTQSRSSCRNSCCVYETCFKKLFHKIFFHDPTTHASCFSMTHRDDEQSVGRTNIYNNENTSTPIAHLEAHSRDSQNMNGVGLKSGTNPEAKTTLSEPESTQKRKVSGIPTPRGGRRTNSMNEHFDELIGRYKNKPEDKEVRSESGYTPDYAVFQISSRNNKEAQQSHNVFNLKDEIKSELITTCKTNSVDKIVSSESESAPERKELRTPTHGSGRGIMDACDDEIIVRSKNKPVFKDVQCRTGYPTDGTVLQISSRKNNEAQQSNNVFNVKDECNNDIITKCKTNSVDKMPSSELGSSVERNVLRIPIPEKKMVDAYIDEMLSRYKNKPEDKDVRSQSRYSPDSSVLQIPSGSNKEGQRGDNVFNINNEITTKRKTNSVTKIASSEPKSCIEREVLKFPTPRPGRRMVGAYIDEMLSRSKNEPVGKDVRYESSYPPHDAVHQFPSRSNKKGQRSDSVFSRSEYINEIRKKSKLNRLFENTRFESGSFVNPSLIDRSKMSSDKEVFYSSYSSEIEDDYFNGARNKSKVTVNKNRQFGSARFSNRAVNLESEQSTSNGLSGKSPSYGEINISINCYNTSFRPQLLVNGTRLKYAQKENITDKIKRLQNMIDTHKSELESMQTLLKDLNRTIGAMKIHEKL